MSEKLSNQADKRAQHLNNLHQRVLQGDIGALSELSKIALGGLRVARNLINQIDSNQSFGSATGLNAQENVIIYENQGGGVQLYDWSSADQKRMLEGKRPQGIPDHRNI